MIPMDTYVRRRNGTNKHVYHMSSCRRLNLFLCYDLISLIRLRTKHGEAGRGLSFPVSICSPFATMTSTLPPLVQAVSGASGSAFANALTYPLDLVTTRVQLQSPSQAPRRRRGANSPAHILRHIIRKKGWASLYDGIWTDTTATLLSKYVL
jgi:hypothetical protein